MLQRRALGLVVRRAVPLGDLINGGMAKQLIEKQWRGTRRRDYSIRVKSIPFESKNGRSTKVVMCLEGKSRFGSCLAKHDKVFCEIMR